MPATLGDVTKAIFLHDPEAHKLHMAFTVKATKTVHMGDLVVLDTDGTIEAAASGAVELTLIGVAMDDGVAGDIVTVAMKAFCVVVGEAQGVQTAGAVELAAWNAGTVRREYDATTDTTNVAKTVGHQLSPAAAADGDEIIVALIG